jgi:dolichyl-phosphate beta-glucosyltransferase
MKLSLCIPLYNEEKILKATMDEISAYMKGRFDEDYEVVYIDDGSSDKSLEILKEHADGHTRVISYHPNRGKGCAVRTGILEAKGETVIFTDCDLAYGTEIIGSFFDHMTEHPELDALIGSRSRHPEGYEGYTFGRKLLSKGYLRFLSIYGGLGLSDSQSGIKAFRRETAQSVFSLATVDRFAFDLEIILLTRRLGKKIGEYPVKIINHRPSTIHFFRDSMRMLRDVRKIKKRIKKLKIEK